MEKDADILFKTLETIHRAIENFKKRKKIVAAPFQIIYWSTDKIKYDCSSCYRGDKLSTNDTPFYCAHQEVIEQYILLGAKPLHCINCDFYKQR